MQQLIFGVLALASFGFFAFNLRKIFQNIHLGLPLDRSDNKAARWRTMLLVALGQKKNVQSSYCCTAALGPLQCLCYYPN